MIIRGVPEPFNYPWIYGIQRGRFEGINIQWQDEPSGTGALCQSFEKGEIQLATSLTDATIQKISTGTPCTVLDFFVLSPLTWTIHTCNTRSQNKITDFTTPAYAISRLGSGSQTMANMEAKHRNATIAEKDWHIVHTMEQAVQSLCNKETDVFFWEKYITAPYVRNGQLKRIGEIKTKWPSFVLTVQDQYYQTHSKQVKQVHSIIRTICNELSQDPTLQNQIAEYYGMHSEDAEQWVQDIQWNF